MDKTQDRRQEDLSASIEPSKITGVEHISAELIIVHYSDATSCVYTAVQLLALTPVKMLRLDENVDYGE